MRKTFIVLFGISILITMFAFTSFNPPRFKNLQVLPKDISDRALDSAMDHYKASLGVKCDFCHVRNKETDKFDMANDAKPEKLIARKMLLMTDSINKKFFPPEEGSTGPLIATITCYTCHKGEPMPKDAPDRFSPFPNNEKK